MADPVEQIFLQAQAPTGKWDLPAQMFSQGVQQGQNQQRLDLIRQEQDFLLPLRQDALRLSNESSWLDIQLKQLAKQREIDIKAGQAELLQLLLDSKNTENGILGTTDKARDIARRYGAAVFANGIGKAWVDNWRGAQAMDEAFNRAAFSDPQLPLKRIVIDEATGKSVVTFEDENSLAERRLELAEDREERIARYQEENLFLNKTKVKQAQERIAQGASRQELINLGFKFREIDQAMRAYSLGVQIPEDEAPSAPGAAPTASPRMPKRTTLIPIARPQTGANLSKDQGLLVESDNVLRQIDQLRDLIGPETVGPVAAAKNILIDRGLANLWPELANQERAQVNQLFVSTASSVAKALRSDSNIAEPERKALVASVPQAGEFLQSPINALNQLNALANGIKERAVEASKRLRRPLSDEVLKAIDEDQLQKMFDAGAIDMDQALRWKRLQAPAQPAP